MPTIKKKGYAGKKHSEQEIFTIAQNASAFVAANKKVFTIILSALGAVLLVLTAYTLMQSMDEQNAGRLFATAYEAYSPATGASPDYARAFDLFRAIHKKYPSSRSGQISAYYAGNSLMNVGRYEDALREYQSFIASYKNDKFMLGLVYSRMGYLYSAMGNQGDAIKAFEQSDSLTGPGVATVELARLYDAAGNSAESQKKYKIISDQLSGTTWAMEAMGKVQKTETPSAPAPVSENKAKAGK